MVLSSPSAPETNPPPVMKVTRYEITQAVMMTIVLGLVAAVLWLWMLFSAPIPDRSEHQVSLEVLPIDGGEQTESPDQSQKVDSPEEETLDPALADVESEQTEVEQTIESVLTVADRATAQALERDNPAAFDRGDPGSIDGTAGKPLGMDGDRGGVPRERRWFVRFSDRATLDTYARQLDHFGIELGLVTDTDLTYLSKLSEQTPRKRVVRTGKGERRLYMTWQGSGRKAADLKLFRKAGIDASRGTILHFYPVETEAMLAALESRFRNRRSAEIRRTYFIVRPQGDGFEFVVSRQTLLR